MDRTGLHARPARSEGFWEMWENESEGMSSETVLIAVYGSQWGKGRWYKNSNNTQFNMHHTANTTT